MYTVLFSLFSCFVYNHRSNYISATIRRWPYASLTVYMQDKTIPIDAWLEGRCLSIKMYPCPVDNPRFIYFILIFKMAIVLYSLTLQTSNMNSFRTSLGRGILIHSDISTANRGYAPCWLQQLLALQILGASALASLFRPWSFVHLISVNQQQWIQGQMC